MRERTLSNRHYADIRSHQRGLSLMELMISITIGLLILAALSTLFVNQNKTRSELDKSNRMIDSGRYALELLSDNLRMAGFYDSIGSNTLSGTPSATNDPCTLATLVDAANNLDVLRQHVQGYNAAVQTSQIASLPCGFTYTTGSAATLKAGSDILVLRRASTVTPVAVASAVSGTTYLQASNCLNDPLPYQIVTAPAAYTAFRNKNCTTSAGLRPFIVQVYFVSPDNNVGDGIPTLKRSELGTSGAFVTTPLVEGIEYLQVDYGLDANNDGAPDSYIAAPTLANWPNIVALKLNIIARNTETTSGYTDTKTYALGTAGSFGPFNDSYKRHAYTQMVRLINPSSRREVP